MSGEALLATPARPLYEPSHRPPKKRSARSRSLFAQITRSENCCRYPKWVDAVEKGLRSRANSDSCLRGGRRVGDDGAAGPRSGAALL